MKSVYIVSWLLALAVSFVSCDDWLDKTPKDRLYPDVYFKTEDERSEEHTSELQSQR